MSHKIKANIKAKECRFAVHIPAKDDFPDVHFIKEITHYEDGRIEPTIRYTRDYKRKFWITRQSCRDHNQHKEWEDKSKLLEFTCTQSGMRNQVAKALDMQWSPLPLKKLCSNPFVYGTDISSTALIKHDYQTKYPDVVTPFTVAAFDVETDMLFGTKEVIMATIAFKNKVFTAVIKKFLDGFADPIARIDAAMDKYLGEYVEKRNLQCETYIAEDAFDAVRATIQKAHEWKPDFLAIWNMDFDIPKVIEMCEKAGVDPKDVFCDPSVPPQYRFFRYKQGRKKKVSASGKLTPINPASQWHTVICPSSFYVIDAMCAYKRIRLTEQEEPSYSLDAILNKRLGIRKLKFKEADGYELDKWHMFMQSNYKIEYVIYNRFDVISMLELDEKTKDLSFTIASMTACSDFVDFESQPKLIADAMYFFCLDNDKVIGTAEMTQKKQAPEQNEDDDIVDAEEPEIEEYNQSSDLSGWVVTLPAHMSAPVGMKCIKEDPTISTNIRGHGMDADCTSSYPSDILALNVSKETCKREIIRVQDIDENVFRMENINILSGSVNAVEYCEAMFGFPTLLNLRKEFQAHNNTIQI